MVEYTNGQQLQWPKSHKLKVNSFELINSIEPGESAQESVRFEMDVVLDNSSHQMPTTFQTVIHLNSRKDHATAVMWPLRETCLSIPFRYNLHKGRFM